MKAKSYVLKHLFKGCPKVSDFELVERELPPLKDGEILFESVFLTVDPYTRFFIQEAQIGSTMSGSQVSKVIQTKHPKFRQGENYVTFFGWTTHFIYNPNAWNDGGDEWMRPFLLPDLNGLSISFALNGLGSSGLAALFGLTKIFRLTPGETLVVTAAAGSVGSIVGQIGKILGLNVIGFTGSDSKAKLLTGELKYDYGYNYKKVDIGEALQESAPNGVDCYFDNTGGYLSHEVMLRMNRFGKVIVCGAISTYNDENENPTLVPAFQKNTIKNEIKIEGFLTSRWQQDRLDGTLQLMEMYEKGQLVFKEEMTEGFEKLPEAYLRLFSGDHVGKIIVKV